MREAALGDTATRLGSVWAGKTLPLIPNSGLTITHNFRALREQPKGQVGDNKKGAADNTL